MEDKPLVNIVSNSEILNIFYLDCEQNKIIFALFDSVPGGAGHVKRLLDKDEMINAFNKAYEKVNQNCCNSACYLCIKNYQNQSIHHLLSRENAREFISYMIKSIK